MLVLVDDVSLTPGSFRIRGRGSAGGHNGLSSVEDALESREYARLRIGVGGPPSDEIDLAAWVLHAPSDAEEQLVLESFDRMAEAIEVWMADGVESAMNKFN
jgi:PTH1 family peptidyl-tRNA hydrolase